MKQKKCLIAGLPDSGKSTYLGALWYVINNSKNKDVLTLKATENNPPEDVEQLVNLSTRWLRVEDMDRTSTDVPNNISFNLKHSGSDEDYTLNVPDFRGESIRQIITMNQPKEFDEWCESSDSLIFLMSEVKPGRFVDDYNMDADEINESETRDVSGESSGTIIPVFDPKKMPLSTQNMLILRFLFEKRFSKVVICLTAWDKVMADYPDKSPEDYVREEAPAMYNFIKHRCPQAMFMGLSAQGAEYRYEDYFGDAGVKERRVTGECRTRLQGATRRGERAFVVVNNEKNYDITLPIAEVFK